MQVSGLSEIYYDLKTRLKGDNLCGIIGQVLAIPMHLIKPSVELKLRLDNTRLSVFKNSLKTAASFVLFIPALLTDLLSSVILRGARLDSNKFKEQKSSLINEELCKLLSPQHEVNISTLLKDKNYTEIAQLFKQQSPENKENCLRLAAMLSDWNLQAQFIIDSPMDKIIDFYEEKLYTTGLKPAGNCYPYFPPLIEKTESICSSMTPEIFQAFFEAQLRQGLDERKIYEIDTIDNVALIQDLIQISIGNADKEKLIYSIFEKFFNEIKPEERDDFAMLISKIGLSDTMRFEDDAVQQENSVNFFRIMSNVLESSNSQFLTFLIQRTFTHEHISQIIHKRNRFDSVINLAAYLPLDRQKIKDFLTLLNSGQIRNLLKNTVILEKNNSIPNFYEKFLLCIADICDKDLKIDYREKGLFHRLVERTNDKLKPQVLKILPASEVLSSMKHHIDRLNAMALPNDISIHSQLNNEFIYLESYSKLLETDKTRRFFDDFFKIDSEHVLAHPLLENQKIKIIKDKVISNTRNLLKTMAMHPVIAHQVCHTLEIAGRKECLKGILNSEKLEACDSNIKQYISKIKKYFEVPTLTENCLDILLDKQLQETDWKDLPVELLEKAAPLIAEKIAYREARLLPCTDLEAVQRQIEQKVGA